jgi:hypothetical protein
VRPKAVCESEGHGKRCALSGAVPARCRPALYFDHMRYDRGHGSLPGVRGTGTARTSRHVRPRWEAGPIVGRPLLLTATNADTHQMRDVNLRALQLITGGLIAARLDRSLAPAHDGFQFRGNLRGQLLTP